MRQLSGSGVSVTAIVSPTRFCFVDVIPSHDTWFAPIFDLVTTSIHSKDYPSTRALIDFNTLKTQQRLAIEILPANVHRA